jgi:prophage regulatory protein
METRRVIRWPELRELVGLSRSTINRLERADEFPRRVRVGRRSVAWFADEVVLWQQDIRLCAA